jgi:hypothetical protein
MTEKGKSKMKSDTGQSPLYPNQMRFVIIVKKATPIYIYLQGMWNAISLVAKWMKIC